MNKEAPMEDDDANPWAWPTLIVVAALASMAVLAMV